ncbi:MAG: MoxR family ATPase [Gammaproteobacteria bacterium]|nr:MoxR family ATPase [Gammaproteobacteria bacterium]
MLGSIPEIEQRLAGEGYIADRELTTTVYLAGQLQKPLFLEGEPGVGKTALAKAIARLLDTDLIRLQCYEGLDAQSALYEWNYLRQMLEIRLQEARGIDKAELGRNIFDREFLLRRPLLQAIQYESPRPPVLLVDEIDRSDEEFEAFLLELLSDFQITIPEIGTIKAARVPFVVLTSNRTREMHDALKRRCLYHWIDYPGVEKEQAIVAVAVPGIREQLAGQICRFMEQLRQQDFYKRPGVAETIDWANALLALGIEDLEPEVVKSTLSCILKYRSDQEKLTGEQLQKAIAVTKNFKGRAVGTGRRAAI